MLESLRKRLRPKTFLYWLAKILKNWKCKLNSKREFRCIYNNQNKLLNRSKMIIITVKILKEGWAQQDLTFHEKVTVQLFHITRIKIIHSKKMISIHT